MPVSLSALNEMMKGHMRETRYYNIDGKTYSGYQLKCIVNTLCLIRGCIRSGKEIQYHVDSLIKTLKDWEALLVAGFKQSKRKPFSSEGYYPDWMKHIGIDVETQDLYPITELGEQILAFLEQIEIQVSLDE